MRINIAAKIFIGFGAVVVDSRAHEEGSRLAEEARQIQGISQQVVGYADDVSTLTA